MKFGNIFTPSVAVSIVCLISHVISNANTAASETEIISSTSLDTHAVVLFLIAFWISYSDCKVYDFSLTELLI
jgi:hypothetical protein